MAVKKNWYAILTELLDYVILINHVVDQYQETLWKIRQINVILKCTSWTYCFSNLALPRHAIGKCIFPESPKAILKELHIWLSNFENFCKNWHLFVFVFCVEMLIKIIPLFPIARSGVEGHISKQLAHCVRFIDRNTCKKK